MQRLIALCVVLLAGLCGCSDEFSPKGYEVGPHGEPPPALKLVYRKEFVAAQKNYVLALGEIHAFLIENGFQSTFREQCFGDVMDIRVTAHIRRHKEAFPCVVIQATKGSELTEVYLRVTVNEVDFNRADRDNRVGLTVHMYGKNVFVPTFASNVEPDLQKLHAYAGAQGR